jgi:asparagine synthase (glutamine-hydrolysing)
MSGIAVLYNPDGRPADRALFERMLALIAHRGPDGAGHWLDGEIAIGYQKLCTTPESVNETQPAADPAGRLHLVFDGRVDNRGELAAAVRDRGIAPRDQSDAELVLRTYECFGAETPLRILGDFCMVVWDSDRRELFCARDICAVRKLYYYYDGKSFLAGTEIVQLLADPRVPHEPDEGALGEYIAGALNSTEDTLYRHIKRVPAAHSITISRNGLIKRRYFDLDPRHPIRYRSDREYSEHFSEIFQEAIRCRTRVHGSLGAHLSGGVDSTSIVGMLEWMRRAGTVTSPFETYSLVFDDPTMDERPYIHDAVAMLGLTANYLRPFVLDLDTAIGSIERFKEFTEYPNGATWHPLWRKAREKGSRVLLGGTGSDEWMFGTPWYLADFILRGDLRGLLHALKSHTRFFRGTTGLVPSLTFLAERGLWPLLPLEIRKAIRRIRRQRVVPAFIRDGFVRRNDLWNRVQFEPRLPGASFGQWTIYSYFVDGWVMHGREMISRDAAQYEIEERYPFLDRRIPQFLISLPDDQPVRDWLPKFILRQAMRGKIPDSVCNRRDKAYFTVMFTRVFELFGGEKFFDRMVLDEAGIVDRVEFLKCYRERLAQWDNANLWPIWNTLAAELWYRLAYLNEDPAQYHGSIRQAGNLSA